MKLVNFILRDNFATSTRIGLIFQQKILDLKRAYAELILADEDPSFAQKLAALYFPSDMIGFFKSGKRGIEAIQDILTLIGEQESQSNDDARFFYEMADIKLLAPVPRPNTIRDFSTFEEHQKRVTLQKSGGKVPDVFYEIPVYWKANPDNTIGPEEDIHWPSFTEKLDFELEFGVYISKQGKNIPVEEADDYIAGYTIFNDISARDQQEKEMAMTFGPAKGKDFDNSKIFGPCMVTPDEFSGKSHLMTARINGELWSQSTTDGMLWSFPQMIAYVSQSETLYPGDFLASGTCPTGTGIELNRWIKPGDVIELEVEGIGVLRNKVVRM